MKQLKNQRGISLIEVVASIVLISILILSFFSLFIQSNKTKVASSNTVDLTYYAQSEMEKIYSYTTSSSSTKEKFLLAFGYIELENENPVDEGANFQVYEKEDTTNKLTYVITIKRIENHKDQTGVVINHEALTGVVIKVTKENSKLPPAQMETILNWRAF